MRIQIDLKPAAVTSSVIIKLLKPEFVIIRIIKTIIWFITCGAAGSEGNVERVQSVPGVGY